VRVTEVAIYRVDLPLAEPFQHASSGLVTALEEVVAAVRTDAGLTGYGEVRGNCGYVTGDVPDRVVAVAAHLAPLLLGRPVEDLARLRAAIEDAVVGNSGAKALLDIALHDLLARARGISVAALLGGQVHDRLPTDVSVPFGTVEAAADQASRAVREGYRTIKVRVGGPAAVDEARLAAVREAVDAAGGAEVTVAVDANGTLEAKEAVRRLRRWERYGLGWVEQPVPAWDIRGLRYVREHTDVPVMADESVLGPREVLTLVQEQAVDMLHFKLVKAGGFVPVRRMMAIAEAAEIPYMVGQMDEGMVATAAAVQCAAASRAAFFEVHGHKRVAMQPFSGIRVADGAVIVPQGPGLAVDVDERALRLVFLARADDARGEVSSGRTLSGSAG
jgi:L-alanine-DL-glutamate epimerase-like enolase superfamily enzyme